MIQNHPNLRRAVMIDVSMDWRALLSNETDLDANSTSPPTSMSSEPIYNDMFSRNRPAAVFMILFILVFLASCVYSYQTWSESNNDETNDNLGDGADGVTPEVMRIAKMNPEERTELYNRKFDENKRQAVVRESWIIVHDHNSSETEEDDDDDDSSEIGAFDNDASIYLALEEVRSIRRSTLREASTRIAMETASAELQNSTSASPKSLKRQSSIIHPRSSMHLEEGGACCKSKSDQVRGNCVICFEDFQAGDTVVWSENKACNHVYHKDCMVAYFTHKRRTLREIMTDNNPCPTCRRKFVTVCPPAK